MLTYIVVGAWPISVAELLESSERAVLGIDVREEECVSSILIMLRRKAWELASGLEGQDIVEYALVVGLLSLGITASSNFLASALVKAFQGISSTLGSYIS